MILQAHGIYKKFGNLNVLKGVNLQLEKGKILSIVGKSGSGKSTLLHILGTLDTPDKGELIIDNIAINSLRKNKLAHFRNKKIGFIFQFHHLLDEFNAIENVMIPALIGKKSYKESKEYGLHLLDLLGLSDRISHKPNQLSGGEQQRVAVARALINKPDLILADEPTGNLDSESSLELHNLLFELRDRFNLSFIIVTHNADLAKMSDITMTMRDGILVRQEQNSSSI
ncbi:MAG TPA: ABC transporter ATP-binding protein [Bacteroidetes bacterium]|nr:ABC transporter ATP-binding protein [Bacteroidota bacterium]